MDATNPFAETPSTPEPVVAQVYRQLRDDPGVRRTTREVEVHRLADDAVQRLWDSRVKTFVPVLALRSVREELMAAHQASAPEPTTGTPLPEKTEPRRRDVLSASGDVLPHEPSDRLLA